MPSGQNPSPYPPSSRPTGASPRSTSSPAQRGPSEESPAQTIDPMRLILTYWPWGVGAGIVGLVLGIGVYFMLARYAPAYVSSAIFQASAPSETVEQNIGVGIGTQGADEIEIFMETQVENMVSDRLLRQAINEPGIRETNWVEQFTEQGSINTVEALLDLRERVGASVIPDTLYMRMNARFSSRTDAKIIADVLTEVYRNDYRRQTNAQYNNTIQVLENTLRTTQEDIANIDRRLENLLAEEQVSSIEQRETSQYAEVQQIQPTLVEIRDQRAQMREQLSSFEQMLNSPGGVQYPDSIRSQAEQHPIVMAQDQAIANEKAALRSVRSRFGENHRDVLRRKSLLAALEQERNSLLEQKTHEIFRSSIEGLRSNIANLEESERDLQERLRQAQNELVEITQVIQRHDNLEQDRLENQEAIAELNARIQELQLKTQQGGRVSLVAAPDLPDAMAFPSLKVTVGGTAFLVVASVGGLILLKEMREQRVRGPQDVKAIPRTRVLGVIPDITMDPSKPESVEMASRDKPHGILGETFRQLRGSIMKSCDAHDIKTIHVCAGMPESGASSVVSNLAIKLCVAGERVLIIDGNIRRPRMHKIFGLSLAPGLSECLTQQHSLDDTIVSTSDSNIDLLPAGDAVDGVFEKLPTRAMAEIMRQARERYDVVLVDSSPGVVAEDAISIANHCDATILVARAYSEKRGLIARLRHQLGDTSAEFLGVVVNGVQASAGGYFKKNYKTTHDYTNGVARSVKNEIAETAVEEVEEAGAKG